MVGAHGTIGADVNGLVVDALSSDIGRVLTLPHSILGSHVSDKARGPGVVTRIHAPAVCWIFFHLVQVTYKERAKIQSILLASSTFFDCGVSNPV